MTFKQIYLENKNDIETLSKIATAIIREHYDPIVGHEQNTYMIDRFQSVHAITSQLENGYIYFLVLEKDIPIGFVGLILKQDYLYISKLYLQKDFRGQGRSKDILGLIIDIAKKNGLNRLELNVNKYNYNSIKAYEHLGFKRIRDEVNDIGNGYVMDDYVYEYSI